MKRKLLTLLVGLVLCATLFGAGTIPPSGVLKHSTVYAASLVVKAAPGTLVALFGYNSGAAQWIQVYDSTTLPSNGAVPIATFTVAATSNFYLDVPMTGLDCGTGIVVGNSSTGPTKTIGAADCFFTAIYR